MNHLFDAAFAAFLIIGALQDARRREVQHWVVIVLALIALTRMFYAGEYSVLFSLIPTGILIVMWYIHPEACGAADIKVVGCILLYTGLGILPLLAVMAACILAMMHILIGKHANTPFCYWLGLAGSALMAVRILT
ncbi:MAG TPA: hypothetical protein PKB13_08160 [Clostridia bacterium]|nr:hypothetical protein [Clostridia bacterium]